MVIAEVGWLHVAGQAAGTILLLELSLALFLMLAVMVGLAFGAWWVRRRVVPVVTEYAPKALQAMTIAQEGSDKVVHGVAEFYGRRQQIGTSVRVLLFGRKAARRYHDEELVQTATDLQMMTDIEEPSAIVASEWADVGLQRVQQAETQRNGAHDGAHGNGR